LRELAPSFWGQRFLGDPRSIGEPCDPPEFWDPYDPRDGLALTSWTDAEGRARFTDVPPWSFVYVEARPKDGKPYRCGKPFLVRPGDRNRFDLSLDRVGSIRGVVLDQDGEPIAGLPLMRVHRVPGLCLDPALGSRHPHRDRRRRVVPIRRGGSRRLVGGPCAR
jgi:hypothetical protein